MHSVVNSTLYVDNMNVNLIQSFSLTSNFPSKVRANCIIGTMGSRRVRVPGSFRDLSGLALRLCVSAAYPRGMIHSVVVVVAAGRQALATYSATMAACVLDNDNDKSRRWRVRNNDKPDKSPARCRITGHACV